MSDRIQVLAVVLAIALALVAVALGGCDEAAERRAELTGDYSQIATETEGWK